MSDTTNPIIPQTNHSVPLRDSVTPQKVSFVPQPSIIFEDGNPAVKLKAHERAVLLSVFNRTRSGKNQFVVELTYEKQTNAPLRINGSDYQIPSEVSVFKHLGLVIRCDKGAKDGHWYLRLADHLRSDRGEIGYTSVRLVGLTSFKVITRDPGAYPEQTKAKDKIIDIV